MINTWGRRWAPPFLKWLATPNDSTAGLGQAEDSAPWTSSEGSPLTVWLVTAALRRSFESPTKQRDLNAALELMRLDSFQKPLFGMYVALLTSGRYPVEEVFARVFANLLLVGFIAGQMHEREPAPVGEGPYCA